MASTIKCDTIQSTTSNVFVLNSVGTEYARFDATGVFQLANPSSFPAGNVASPSITTAGDLNTGIFFSAADTIDFAEGGTATGQFDSSGNFKFNSGYGSVATAYACRAWCNFNGANGTIRASGGVSSITRNADGEYTATLSFTMPDTNYSVSGSAMYATSTNSHFFSYGDFNGQANNPPTTTTFKFRTVYAVSATTSQDCGIVTFAVFR
jgi:hypothetical protein